MVLSRCSRMWIDLLGKFFQKNAAAAFWGIWGCVKFLHVVYFTIFAGIFL